MNSIVNQQLSPPSYESLFEWDAITQEEKDLDRKVNKLFRIGIALVIAGILLALVILPIGAVTLPVASFAITYSFGGVGFSVALVTAGIICISRSERKQVEAPPSYEDYLSQESDILPTYTEATGL